MLRTTSPASADSSPCSQRDRSGGAFAPGRTALLAAIAIASAVPALARPEGPGRNDRTITRAVRFLMEHKHLSRQPIDDTMSERCLGRFLETLDPMKRYFYEADVARLSQYETELDRLFKEGRTDFAHEVFNLFLARVEERVETALKWVDAEHDFALTEQIVSDPDIAEYARTPEEAADRWRRRVKFDLMVKLAEKSPFTSKDEDDAGEQDTLAAEPYSETGGDEPVDLTRLREVAAELAQDEEILAEARQKLRKRYKSLRKRWNQTSSDELLELYITAMTSGFDPHSSYLSPSTLEDFNIQMRLELDGIGASLKSEDGYTEVAEVIAGGAAAREGSLTKGDKIIGVGQGTDGPVEDIVDMKLRDVVKLIRGKRGTIVRLQVNPVDNPNDVAEYVITRDRIELKNQEARSEVIEWGQKPSGEPFRLGVIDLPSFYMDMDGARLGLPNFKSATNDVRRLLDDFRRRGDAGEPIDAVVFDLRFNGGGSLTEAVNLTGLFIDRGPVVQVKGTDGMTVPYADEAPGMSWDGPLVVLTNRFSASASEIFAGAIQDYGRGIVVGDESTHGKGTVQQLFDLGSKLFGVGSRPNLGALKMTIQQFYRPSGDSTQNRGVLADVTIPCLTDHLKGVTEAEMDYALRFDRVRALTHDRLGMGGAAISGRLQRLSDSRVAASEDFARDLLRINRYEKQKDRTTLPLNLEEHLAELVELDQEAEEKEIGEQLSDAEKPVFDTDDHYNQEALSIAVDYLRLLGENRLAVARSALPSP
ncbi:MAG: carboxy terminal-processing peptidase [Planctomycetota bacterium]